MRIKEVNERIKKYLKKRKEIALLDEKLKMLKSDKAFLESEVVLALGEMHMKSTIAYGKRVAVSHKKEIKVYDEEALLREFAQRKDMDYIGEFTKKKVDVAKFKRFAKTLLKEKGELLSGTEETESNVVIVTDFIGDILSI